MSDPRKSKIKPIEKMTFEECFSELEQLVGAFEDGQLPLSESVIQFERGMQLVKRCTEELDQADRKVSDLLRTLPPDTAGKIPQEKSLDTEVGE
jgi:exodeoxyribonuclease VII small subunit